MPPGHSALAAQRTPRFRFARCLPQLSLQPLELSGGTAVSEPRPLGAARNHCPFGLQMLQPGRAGQRGMAGCGPGRCAVTLTAASRICSAALVLARPGRRGPKPTRWPAHPRRSRSGHRRGFPGSSTSADPASAATSRGRDITPPPMFAHRNVRYALTTCAGLAAMC
jgi:hypothetical protein